MKVDWGQNVQLIASLWRFIVSTRRLPLLSEFDSSNCQLDSSFEELFSSFLSSLVILSVRFVSWPFRLVVLRVRLIIDPIDSTSFVVLPFPRFVMEFHRFPMAFRPRFDSPLGDCYLIPCTFT